MEISSCPFPQRESQYQLAFPATIQLASIRPLSLLQASRLCGQPVPPVSSLPIIPARLQHGQPALCTDLGESHTHACMRTQTHTQASPAPCPRRGACEGAPSTRPPRPLQATKPGVGAEYSASRRQPSTSGRASTCTHARTHRSRPGCTLAVAVAEVTTWSHGHGRKGHGQG